MHNSQRASPALCPQGWLFLRQGTIRPQWTPSGFTSVIPPPVVHLPLLSIYKVLKVLKQGFSLVTSYFLLLALALCPAQEG